MAVGPGKTTPHGTVITPTVQVGDAVLFEKFAGTNVKFEGEDFLIIKESEILAIV